MGLSLILCKLEVLNSTEAKPIDTCAYNSNTGNLNHQLSTNGQSRLNINDQYSPLVNTNNDIDLILPRSTNSIYSCEVNIGYDNEAPLTITEYNRIENLKKTGQGNKDGKPVLQSEGLGTITKLSAITSNSYKDNNGNQTLDAVLYLFIFLYFKTKKDAITHQGNCSSFF